MAEFAKIMRDWQRMCDSAKNCSDCKLNATCKDDPQSWDFKSINEMEDAVTAWAARHPTPKYPTWLEWIHQQVPATYNVGDTDVIYVLATTTVPDWIAEQLAIPPKE